jgi:hypothetical protein
MLPICQIIFLFPTMTDQVRDLRFDNVPFGRTQFAPTLWTKSVTVGAQSLRPPIDRDLRFDNMPSGWSDSSTERFSGWDIIPTQVPKHILDIDLRLRL